MIGLLPTTNFRKCKIRDYFFMFLIFAFQNAYCQGYSGKLLGNQYADVIKLADDYLIQENYLAALNEYEKAWDLYPRQKYSEKKIDQIYRTLANTPLLKTLYEKSINLGDSCFMANDFRSADIAYFNALKLDHSAQYPKDQLIAISKLYIDPQNETRCRVLFIRGERATIREKYDNAINFYELALLMKPADTWLLMKLDETTSQKTKYIASIDEYSKCLNFADILIEQNKWDEARSEYAKAAAIQPKQNYPVARIVLIDYLKKNSLTKQQSYQFLIAAADKFFKLEDYENAGNQYQEAADLKPGESYPKNMLKKLKHLSSQTNAQVTNYDAAVTNSDILSLASDEKAALIGYQRCLLIQPDDNYVKSRIRELTSKHAKLIEKDDPYSLAINRGISSMESANYTKALSEFRYASRIKPGEKLPNDKILAIDSILENQKNLLELKTAIKNPVSKPTDKQFEAKTIAGNRTEAKTIEYPPNSSTIANKTIEKSLIANQEEYDKAIAFADKALDGQNYVDALKGYKAAISLKPNEKYPQEKITSINSILGQQKALKTNYERTLVLADRQFQAKQFEEALINYRTASKNNPVATYPKEQIDKINSLMVQENNIEQGYENKIAVADKSFVQERILAANTFKSETKIAQDNYNKAISNAEKAFAAKDYKSAIEGYQIASTLKPIESYPNERIAFINEMISTNIKKIDKQYVEYINQADEFYQNQELLVAKKAYELASAIKPAERYPNDRIIEISNMLIAKAKADKEEYENALLGANKAFQENDLNLAAQLYLAAFALQPKNPYPGQMITKIRKLQMENSVVEVTSEVFILKKETEKQFYFDPIDYSLRKRNCIIIRARTMDSLQPKLIVNYGREKAKNGGVVLKSIDSRLYNDFALNISVQDKWFREDNNWLSLYAENGDLEISSIKIAQLK